jgi:D-ribose pyranose/furanose isomerase RbsD
VILSKELCEKVRIEKTKVEGMLQTMQSQISVLSTQVEELKEVSQKAVSTVI